MVVVPIMTPAQSAAGDKAASPEAAQSLEAVTATLDSVALKNTSTTASSPSASAKPVRGTAVRMAVPLDTIPEAATRSSRPQGSSTLVNGTRTLLRRDSLDRREALLKGKEGSRQRRRWENDRLLSNPWAEPPLPSDWEVRPTYPRRSIPYYLAPLWDAAEFQRAIESKMNGNRRNSVRHRRKHGAVTGSAGAYALGMSPMEEAASMIPKEVRARLKHARSAKGLLQDLEEDVRGFVTRWNEREMKMRSQGLDDVPVAGAVSDEEDEEIVFVGRNGAMHDSPPTPTKKGEQGDDEGDEGILEKEKLVFEGLEGDKGAAFGRWLVHCVGSYYGLKTWSVTKEIEGENRREAYVGVDSRVRGWMGRGVEVGREIELPRPLWGMV